MLQIKDFFCFCKVNLQNELVKSGISPSEVLGSSTTDLLTLINDPPNGYMPVMFGQYPENNDSRFYVQELPPTKGDGNFFVRQYEVVEKPPQEKLDELTVAKQMKNAYVNNSRDTVNNTWFMFNGKRVACDQLARIDIDSTNHAINNNALIFGKSEQPHGWHNFWVAKDGSVFDIPDVATWRAMYTAMFEQGNKNFMHSQVLKTMIEQATTVEAVNQIHWDMESPFDKTPLNEG